MRRIAAILAVAATATVTLLSIHPDPVGAQSKKAGPKTTLEAPAYGNADSITEEELKVHLYFIASDQLEGRNFPSRGYDTAALYVASHLAEWGLKPGGSTTGTVGPLQPYMMPMELVSRQIVPEESKLTLTAPAVQGGFGRGGGGGGGAAADQTTPYEYAKEWTVTAAGGRGAPAVESTDVAGNLVFAGNGYMINKTKTNPYEGMDVKGKIIVVAGLPAELAALQNAGGRGGRGGRGAAPAAPTTPPVADAAAGAAANPPPAAAPANPLGEACTDFLTPEQYAAKNGAVAVVTIASFQQVTAMASPGRGGGRGAGLNGPNFQVKKFQQPSACPAAPGFTVGMNLTTALFQGEKLSGSQIFYGAGTGAKQDSFELNARKKLSVHLAVHTEQGHGENVIGIVEGADPVLKNEYVIISAHLDHVGFSAPLPDGHNVNNGADDDGSGSVGVLAMARAFADGAARGMRPKRGVIFLWNGGEEKGLYGSQYFAEFPPVDLGKVVANLNMDMIGRTKNEKSVDPNQTHVLVNPGEVLLIGPNISSDDLEEIIEGVNNNYQKLKLNHFYDTTAPDATHDNLGPQPNGQRVFYRSDHYNFAKVGIPIAFFTTGLHVDYHRPTDTPDKIDYKAMQQISKTVAATAWSLANQAGRPKLKSKLPDQLVKDMKTVQQQGWGKLTPVIAPLPGQPY